MSSDFFTACTSSLNGLNVYYQNVRGLRTKVVDLYNNVVCSNFDMVVLTETWLNSGIQDAELFDNRYIVYRRDRENSGFHSKKNGGGVLIAVTKNLSSKRLQCFESNCEDLWISVEVADDDGKPQKMYICAVYLPPPLQKHILSEFFNNANSVIDKNCINNVAFLGDFNMGTISWDFQNSLCQNSNVKCNNSLYSNMLIDFSLLNDLTQYNNVPNNKNRILDLVLSYFKVINLKECTSPLSVIDPLHPAIEFFISCSPITNLPPNTHTRLCFFKADYVNIIQELNETDWDDKFASDSTVDQMVSTFYNVVRELIARYVPKSKPRSKKYPIWFSRDLIFILREKYKYRKKICKFNNNPRDKLAFELAKSRSDKLQAICYKKYIIQLECSLRSNPKLFWSFIKNKRNNQSHYPAQMCLHDESATDKKSICNLFARNFASAFSNNAAQPLSSVVTHDVNKAPDIVSDYITTIKFKYDQVLKILKRLDYFKGAGTDGIPSVFAAKCAPAIAYPLCLIFNKSLSSGTYPAVWREALVVPIYKNGEKDMVKNYRPISILPVFAKVFEKLLCPVLSWHLKNVISTQQHGFVKCRSTATNLVSFINEVSHMLDQRSTVGVIYTDFSKAFDKVNHELLLRKLSSYGIAEPFLGWCGSYLLDRKSSVVVNGESSDTYNIDSGVPQGSHLGPLLFNIFINDIGQCFKHSNYFLFADDLKFFRVIDCSTDVLKLQEDIDNLNLWCEANVMCLNVSKCFSMQFSRKKNIDRPLFHIKNIILQNVDQIRDLGIIVDTKLRFNIHIDQVVSRGYRSLGFILRNCRDFKSSHTKIMLFNSLVRSGLEYCSVAWNPFYEVYCKRLESVQKRFLCHLTYSSFLGKELLSYNDRLNHFGMLSLALRRDMLDGMFLYKIVHGMVDTPHLLSELSISAPYRLPRASRFNVLQVAGSHSNLGHNAPLNRLARQYNTISKNKEVDIFADSIHSFRNSLLT